MTRVCVLTLTRDRLTYTKHCFTSLEINAGCEYAHFVRDQGSTDGTPDWLKRNERAFDGVIYGASNIGISKAMNELIGLAGPDYDVYVKVDNDCELTVPGTLAACCEVALENSAITSPHIQGLKQPPPIEQNARWGDYRVGLVGQLGGIFMAIPAFVFAAGFRYDEDNPVWGMDDVQLSQWFRERGHPLAYLLDFPAQHFLTTAGQEADQPAYFDRKFREMGLL